MLKHFILLHYLYIIIYCQELILKFICTGYNSIHTWQYLLFLYYTYTLIYISLDTRVYRNDKYIFM